MKITTLFIAFFTSLSLLAQVVPDYRPSGTFVYEGQVEVTNKRSAVTVSHISPEGQAKIKEYKAQRFTCLRKSQKESICQKNEAVATVPDFAQNAVDKFLKDRQFDFPGNGEIELVFDGANTEWMVREPVSLGGNKITMYKIVKTFEGRWGLSFPVSEEQPLATMEMFSSDHLAMPLILQAKEAEFTVGYFLNAHLTKPKAQ